MKALAGRLAGRIRLRELSAGGAREGVRRGVEKRTCRGMNGVDHVCAASGTPKKKNKKEKKLSCLGEQSASVSSARDLTPRAGRIGWLITSPWFLIASHHGVASIRGENVSHYSSLHSITLHYFAPQSITLLHIDLSASRLRL